MRGFAGCMILVLFGDGVVAGVLLKRSKAEGGDWTVITAGWAFAVMAGAGFDVAINAKGEVYVAEFGNHRVQKFSPTGEPLGCWGGPGRELGRLNTPWGLAIDSRGRVHVLDSENHRVQRIRFY